MELVRRAPMVPTMTSAEFMHRDGRLPAIIGTFSGGCFHVLDPREDEVRFVDIAHHLSLICRYTGATRELWSVAAHCLEVSHRVEQRAGTFAAQLQGLLHDASEAYLVDIPRPFKPDVSIAGDSYYAVEERLMRVICRALGISQDFDPLVKYVDDGMVDDEVANFFGPGFIWDRYSITEERTNLLALAKQSPLETAMRFIDRYEELSYLVARYGG